MPDFKSLPFDLLRNTCNPELFTFDNTFELESMQGIIGQERAASAMQFGLKVNMKGYNLFISGMTGTGKTSYAIEYISEIAKTGKIPDDWCYLYNFDKPNQPVAINLPAGKGKAFKKDMEDLVSILKDEIIKTFDSEEYEKEKAAIIKDYQHKRDELIEKLNEEAEKNSFKVRAINSGIYFLPVIEGKTLNIQEFGDLDENIRQQISKRSDALQFDMVEIIRKIKGIEKEVDDKIAEWENKIALFAVGTHIKEFADKYDEYDKISEYLENLKQDILMNIGDFKDEDISEEQQVLIPWANKSGNTQFSNYKVNLLVDNSELQGSPVIVDYNPNYYNLLGKVEYENEFGAITTDFTMIKPGLFHYANGGYLILQAKDVLSNIQSWEALKRVIKTKQIIIENVKEQLGLAALSTLKPEPIPVEVKVILVGNEYLYQLLYDYDEDFSKLFKIKVDFDNEMDRTDINIVKLAHFISSFCKREKTLHFDRTGVSMVIEYCSILAGDQSKLTTRFSDIVEMLCEACTWAQLEGARFVGEEHVQQAMLAKKNRSDKYDRKLLELLKDGTVMIDTDKAVIGQINGLAVIDTGDYAFGKPSRITAATFLGKNGIVNIEREVEMSGASHNKGILILSGYIGQKYAQEMPLTLTASVCFEQLYGGIDGDSASSAELYAILSSLSELPIQQGIAVTGSVNQKGEIQPIGGATTKIEGFFELCKLRGLNGKQGVIIPHQNIKNLMLDYEILDAVKAGKFNIYAAKNIDEGIEILTGICAGKRLRDGSYPVNTVNYRVCEKLKKYAKITEDKKTRRKNVRH